MYIFLMCFIVTCTSPLVLWLQNSPMMWETRVHSQVESSQMHVFLMFYCNLYQTIGIMVTMLINGEGDLGSILGQVIPNVHFLMFYCNLYRAIGIMVTVFSKGAADTG